MSLIPMPEIKIMDDLYSQSFIKVKNITISNLESFHKDVCLSRVSKFVI